MLKKYIKVLALSTLVVGMIACGGDTTPEEPIEDEVIDESMNDMDDMEDVSEDITYTLPSPLRVANMFKRSGLSYQDGLTNSDENLAKYNTKFIQKLNFGVYSADLAYCALNNKNQEAIDYMKTLGELSNKLWMTNIFTNVSILERFENNIGNEDSIAFVIADLQMELDSYLEENGLSHNGVIIFAGAWIETMYLGSKVLIGEDQDKLNTLLSEQVDVYDNMVGLCEQNKDEIDQQLVTDLKKIGAHFEPFRQTDEEGEPLEVTLTDEQIKSLARDVEEIRMNMING